jgi:hypothetical protein
MRKIFPPEALEKGEEPHLRLTTNTLQFYKRVGSVFGFQDKFNVLKKGNKEDTGGVFLQ